MTFCRLHRPALLSLLAVWAFSSVSFAASAQSGTQTADIPSPEAHFGHSMGADGQLADWSELATYYRLIGER
ncbi:MAG: hypothetical protein V2I82_00710, partial [Halieaceae bacterium]|nr:hypothetical protein [Halieaceae bacterium]